MMKMSDVWIAVAIMAVVTLFTRTFPFLLFSKNNKNSPKFIVYLGKYFPPAIICAILVYCFCAIDFSVFPFGLKELAASVIVVGLQFWKRNSMISIFSGTGVYMILCRVMGG